MNTNRFLKSLAGSLCFIALHAQAKTAQAEPRIAVELDPTFTARAYLEDGDKLDRCSPPMGYGPPIPVLQAPTGKKSIELSSAPLAFDAYNNAHDGLVLFLLNWGIPQIICFRKDDKEGKQPVSVRVEPLKRANGKGKVAFRSPTPAFAPRYDWPFYHRWRPAIQAALGSPTECKAYPASGKDPIGSCTPLADGEHGTIAFDVKNASAADVRRIDVTFNDSKGDTLVSIDVASCNFRVAGRLSALVSGAFEQRLIIGADEGACARRLEGLRELKLGDGSSIRVTVPQLEAGSKASSGMAIVVHDVRDDLQQGVQAVELHGASGLLGSLHINVVKSITTDPHLQINYKVPVTDDPHGYFESASGLSEKKVAVINPLLAVTAPPPEDDERLTNTANLALPAQLPSASSRLDDIVRPSSPMGGDGDSFEASPADDRLYWRVAGTSWGEAVRFRDCDRNAFQNDDRASNVWGSNDCILRGSVRSLTFNVNQRFERPLEVWLALMRVVPGKMAPTGGQKPGPGQAEQGAKPASREEPLLLVKVPIADGSRRESVPMPIRDQLLVDCEGARDYAYNSETRAIADDDVASGVCSLVFFTNPLGATRPRRREIGYYMASKANQAERLEEFRGEMNELGLLAPAERPSKAGEVRRLSRKQIHALYGPQELAITVRQDGGDPVIKVLPLDPTDLGRLTLPAPPGERKNSNLYTVEVRLNVRARSEITYRSATKDNIDATALDRADQRFVSRLRPRGPFGWKWAPMRAYVTLPVQLVGMRFAASAAELRSSKDPTGFQVVTPRLGALGVIEPWDYNSGSNLLPLRPSLAGGLMMVDLTKPTLSMSTIAGVQAQAPLIEASSQVTTTLSVGLFWEHDLRYHDDHLLITAGANVLSLFAGK